MNTVSKWNRVVSSFAALLLMGLCLSYAATAQDFDTIEAIPDTPIVELAYPGVRDGSSIHNLAHEPLYLWVLNNAGFPVVLDVEARSISAGEDETRIVESVLLAPLEGRLVVLDPDVTPLNSKAEGFASQLLVTAHIRDFAGQELGKVQAPSLFYHRDEATGGTLVYRELVNHGIVGPYLAGESLDQVDEFGSRTLSIGPGQHRPAGEKDPEEVELQDGESQEGEPGAGLKVAAGSAAVKLTVGPAPGGGPGPIGQLVKVCALLKVNYSDSGIGEDHWPTNSDKPARGAYVRVRDGNGTTRFADYTGDGYGSDDPGAGCTPWLAAAGTSNWSMRVTSSARVKDNYVYVTGDDLVAVNWLVTGMTVTPGQSRAYSIPTESAESSALAAATEALYRNDGGMKSRLYLIQLTKSIYYGGSSTGSDRIRLSPADSRIKFNVAHFMGHLLLRHKLGADFRNNLSYDAGGTCGSNYGGGEQLHSMTSKEFSVGAFNEGFAHFYAALTWNSSYQTDGKLHYQPYGYAQVIDVENSIKYMKTTCDPPFWGYGNERDWMTFFWDFRTDSGTKPTFNDILNLIAEASPMQDWAAYFHLESAVANYQDGRFLTRFWDKAAANGIDP
jgi:hypothetical protein